MINRIIQEEIQSFLVEGWKEEVIDMVRDEISHNKKFASWWKSLTKMEKYAFLKAQFKLNLGNANNVIAALSDSAVIEFGELSGLGKYRGTIEQHQVSSMGIERTIKGYKAMSKSYPDKSRAVSVARSLSNSKNVDTYAVQSKSDGRWRVYGKKVSRSKYNY